MDKDEELRLIRLADILIIGPILLYAAFSRSPTAGLRIALIIIAIATIAYNGKNFLEEESN